MLECPVRPGVANAYFSAVLLVAAVAWPFTRGPARLELVENSRAYAPDQPIQVRLVNRGDTPIYFLTEVRRRGARTRPETPAARPAHLRAPPPEVLFSR